MANQSETEYTSIPCNKQIKGLYVEIQTELEKKWGTKPTLTGVLKLVAESYKAHELQKAA